MSRQADETEEVAVVKRKRKYRQIASKGMKHVVMWQHPHLRSCLPETVWYSEENIKKMLRQSPSVFVKPDKGGGGSGIIRIRKLAHRFEICFRKNCRMVEEGNLGRTVGKLLSPSRRYILQEGVELATIEGRPFDIRILLQKPGNRWVLSGMVAKVAARGRFVTNHCKGGQPMEMKKALQAMDGEGIFPEKIMRELAKISYLTADVLERRFPGLKELGIDVGLDGVGKPWIFEVNTRPYFRMFSKIENPSLYRRILNNHRRIIR
ncbi:YheC/YheD family protein [Kroppenstedtia eburnea]|uniref:YheC/D like ATP-grasp n=1 Tax=Kroppenstedtia eburnea TaxID=714067 RepID=A0A1N7JII6_9BACL|nr:YheC/YheD family protein [Kroppenstedtia eburnea]EGK10352.1 YheD like protein [Desmospora sp. 8437]QKI83573.1 YheC/YheD family protein [Kroppenstedtia eburnea]SIS49139.1 YheC/D like ATP-grasp [Kroppenstedtia eburnea]